MSGRPSLGRVGPQALAAKWAPLRDRPSSLSAAAARHILRSSTLAALAPLKLSPLLPSPPRSKGFHNLELRARGWNNRTPVARWSRPSSWAAAVCGNLFARRGLAGRAAAAGSPAGQSVGRSVVSALPAESIVFARRTFASWPSWRELRTKWRRAADRRQKTAGSRQGGQSLAAEASRVHKQPATSHSIGPRVRVAPPTAKLPLPPAPTPRRRDGRSLAAMSSWLVASLFLSRSCALVAPAVP